MKVLAVTAGLTLVVSLGLLSQLWTTSITSRDATRAVPPPEGAPRKAGPFVAIADGVALTTDQGAHWTVHTDARTNPRSVYRHAGDASEARVTIEFGVLPINRPVRVNSASLRFSINYLTTGYGAAVLHPMTVVFYGYGDADGTITAVDAQKIGTPVGRSPKLGPHDSSVGTYTVALDAAFVEKVINSGGRIGIVARSDTADSNAAMPLILSTDNSPAHWGNSVPAIHLEYTPAGTSIGKTP